MKIHCLVLALILLSGVVNNSTGQIIPAHIPTEGLIGWWPFTGNANDESTNQNHGVNNGAVLTTDRFGNAEQAYMFNGTSSYISVPTSASLESPSYGLTMSAWVNLSGVSLVGQPFAPILTKTNSSSNGFMYRLDIDVNATAFFAGINNWSSNVGTPYAFAQNKWYLVTAVIDSFTTYLYVNDTLISSQAFIANIINHTQPLEIGKDTPGLVEIFNGKIDDIGIWKRPLTQNEVKTIFTSTFTGMEKAIAGTHFSVYPNPGRHQLTVRSSENKEDASWTITNVMGKTMCTGILKGRNTVIPLSQISEGIYLLSVGNQGSQKFHVLR